MCVCEWVCVMCDSVRGSYKCLQRILYCIHVAGYFRMVEIFVQTALINCRASYEI